MKNMRWWLVLSVAALAAVMVLPGCSRKDAARDGSAALEEPAAVALTPQEACEKSVADALQAVKDANLLALFAMLPASRQQDFRNLVAAFAGAVPEQLWTETSATASELLDTIRVQMPNILALAKDSMADLDELCGDVVDDPSALVNENELLMLCDAVTEVFAISRQDLLDGKVEKLLGSTALRSLLRTVLDQDGELTRALPVSFELAEAADETAAGVAGEPMFTLTITREDGSSDSELMVCVDGKWFFESLNRQMPELVADAIEEMRQNPISEEDAAAAIAGLRAFRDTLPSIKAATTPEVLQGAVMGAVMAVMGGSSFSVPSPAF